MAGLSLRSNRGLLAICALALAMGAWNTLRYQTNNGYDAYENMKYADGLVPGWHLQHRSPTEANEYYTPPGYYFIAGSVDWVVGKAGYGDPDRGGQVINVVFMLGTVLLVAAIARELWPGRRRIELGAAAFVALLPVAVEDEAMFHPEPLSMFLCTLALWLSVRTFRDRRYAWALGVVLGATQLVRAFGLYTVGAALLALLVGRRWRELVIAVVLAAAISAPWYLHQQLTYHGASPVFAQPAQGKPLPTAFYYGLGISTVVTEPYRKHHYTRWIPVTYDGLWGDYFGVWNWNSARVTRPSASAKRSLVIQSAVGLLPTLLAFCGWLLLARSTLRRPKALAVGVLPLAGLAGYLYYAVLYWTKDGDLLKTSFMLSTTAAWALGFGYALDRLRGRWWIAALGALIACAVIELPFLVV